MAVSIRDILENDEASFLRLVIDSVSDCLVVVDTDGRIVLINKPYCDLLGGTAEDFIDRHIREVVSPVSHLAEVAQGASPRDGTRLVVRGREILTRQVPIWANGDIVGALGMSLFANSKNAVSTLQQLTSEGLVFNSSPSQWQGRYALTDLVGRGAEMDGLRSQIRQCARNNFPILVHGETGTGKELVAQSIHRLSSRNSRPLVWINCATIPADLVSSELFGYEGGAFTGANSRGSKGKIEMADGGTLFLDEIGDMPLHAQASLLRFLQEGEITRVGGNKPIKVDVRIVCASHKDLHALTQQGQFREDLLFRLSVLKISVPSLRQRSDLDLLISHLLARIRLELCMPRLAISPKAVAQIKAHSWPGNVRELLGALQRAAVMLEEGEFEINRIEIISAASNLINLDIDEQAVHQHEEQYPITLKEAVEIAERKTISSALKMNNGNRSKAAQQLNINRTSLYKRLNAWGWDSV